MKNTSRVLKVVTPKSEEVSGARPLPRAPRTRVPRDPRGLGVVDQVRHSLRPTNRLPTALGFLLGGFVPIASFVVAHYELDRGTPLYLQLASYLVLGGLLYSAKTVYEWGSRAFMNAWKAVGFVVLVEGVMVTSSVPWLGYAALAYLVCINGIATGCTLALEKPET